jgi:hypothetical protein
MIFLVATAKSRRPQIMDGTDLPFSDLETAEA